jgi:AcrR family transcriptional regulator
MSRRTKLNSQLLALLNAIDAYQRNHGYAPTVRELAAQAGVSRSVVFYHLRKLELAKLVESEFYKARSLRITEAGYALLEGDTMTRGVTGRTAARRDANEAEIVDALLRAGAVVHRLSGRGLPDLLVGYRGQTYLLEVKAPKDARLTDDERSFFEGWQGSGGSARIVRAAEEALAAVGALER